VVARRAVWKQAQATNTATGEGDIVNICVVDDANNPIRYYTSNGVETFNPMNPDS